MRMPSPAARVVEFRPAKGAEAKSHVRLRPSTTPAEPSTVAPLVALMPFDWAQQSDPVVLPVLPTLVACALDRLTSHVENPSLVSKGDALEALRLIRAHFRPEVD